MKDFRYSHGTNKLDPLEQLARIERSEPGKLASWLRAHPPLREPTNNVYCISVANLNLKGKRTPCSKS